MQIKTGLPEEELKLYNVYYRDMLNRLDDLYIIIDKAYQLCSNKKSGECPSLIIMGNIIEPMIIRKDYEYILKLISAFKKRKLTSFTNHEPDGWSIPYLDQSDMKKLNILWKRYCYVSKARIA